MIDINNEDFYEYNKPKDRTKQRLEELNELGLTEVGFGQFGIKGVMSGLYIEKVWNYVDKEWNEYVNWIKEVKEKKRLEKFESLKEMFLANVEELKQDFDELTKQVSPSWWRNTGTQYANLNKLVHDVEKYTPITEKEKEIDWVKKELNK